MTKKENKGAIEFPRRKDWHYYVDVNYEYEYDCDEFNCDPYCRCGVLVDLKVNVPSVHEAISMANCYFVKGEGASGNLGLALAARFFRHGCGAFEDMFEVEAVGGYYGEEIGSVRATEDLWGESKPWKDFRDSIEKFNKASNAERLRQVLELEYGEVLPEVQKWAEWQLIEVPLDKVHANKAALGRTDEKVAELYMGFTPWYFGKSNRYVDSWFPGVIVVPSGDDYRLTDGFHRYKAWTTKPRFLSDAKWKRLRKNKKIKVIAPVV